ncbi:cysteine and histidine-rich domain-containing protein RAR1 isoform X2 [Cryptomeria japonica]|uniref:cysteine and histidine-rich domain-containing protein RAR1 isoform X2 n=1 Tax=Cryptomeria japonica TaxID=3369 RepID=UPI0027D9EEBF|nr:cysteine and histidine-rich domain-containing protein RAR1 isoform X2 [Cryptomeria japonica]
MATETPRVRCQRIACDAFFTEDDNTEESCQYHDGPLFHDGTKEWSCCKQRSHDFSLFLAIPGCKKGKHTSEKPQTKAAPSPNKPIVSPVTGNAALDAAKEACGRCRQGFFCSDHGSQVGNINSQCYKLAASETAKPEPPAPKPAKIIDLNQPQVCKNKGCGQSFIERDNHETACHYHPGPAVFHDRLRGWQCCDVHVKEFDEFLSIPPCAKGWHNANPDN